MCKLLPLRVKTCVLDATETLRSPHVHNPVSREVFGVFDSWCNGIRVWMNLFIHLPKTFERLFDICYGWQSGMDEESKERKLKWQEKILPIAKTFSDSLHRKPIPKIYLVVTENHHLVAAARLPVTSKVSSVTSGSTHQLCRE